MHSENQLYDYVLNCKGNIFASQQRDVIVTVGERISSDLESIRVKDTNSNLTITLIANKKDRTLKIIANNTDTLYKDLFEMSITELLQNHGVGFYITTENEMKHIHEITHEDIFFNNIRSVTIDSYEYVVEGDYIYVINPDGKYLRNIEETIKTILEEER